MRESHLQSRLPLDAEEGWDHATEGKLCNPKFDVVPHMNLGIECAAAVLLAVSQRKEEERESTEQGSSGYESSREGWFDKCKEEVGLI